MPPMQHFLDSQPAGFKVLGWHVTLRVWKYISVHLTNGQCSTAEGSSSSLRP